MEKDTKCDFSSMFLKSIHISINGGLEIEAQYFDDLYDHLAQIKEIKKIKVLIMLAHKSGHKLFKLIGKDCCKMICDLL